MKALFDLKTKIVDLQNQLECRKSELSDIASMGIMLTSMLNIDAILSAMMEMSLRIVSAEVGCILLQEDGHLATRTSWGVDASVIRKIRLEKDIDIAEWTFQASETVIINDFPLGSQSAPVINSVLSVPISYNSDPVGVLLAVNNTNGGFSEADREAMERLVNFAAVAIENAKLTKELLKQQRLEQELSLAREIQKALLPNLDVNIGGVNIESLYVPAGKVGGDYLDLITVSEAEFIVIVGDVSNKGVPAALMMTAVRSAIRAVANQGKPVAEIVSHINRVLCLDVMKYPEIFITLVFARFNLKDRTCTYTNAGHLPPFLYNKYTGNVRQLTAGGIIIGQFEEFQYKDETIQLQDGDKLLMFTDGATECVNVDDQMYGRERLGEFFVNLGDVTPKEFIYQLKNEIESFTYGAGETQFDDLTAVVIEIGGGADE
jgi:sigma-B regulation protein RsbU (phosphoserine phosphatase)